LQTSAPIPCFSVAFHIQPGEHLPHAIRRLARKELAKAHDAAGDERRSLNARVHDVRTAVKKLRALDRLVGPEVGGPARRADHRLRKIARTVGPLRDANVVLKTFDRLLDAGDEPMRAAMAGARAHLASGLSARTRAFAKDRQPRRLRSKIEHERRDVGDWAPHENRWRAIGEGLMRGYRRAREAMALAYRSGSGADFHAWRRAVKTHRHQVAALEPVAPGLTARLKRLDQLGELLGDEHDLVVLEAAIQEQSSRITDQHQRQRLLRRIADRQANLRRRARPLGQRLFADPPAIFRDHTKSAFRAFRSR
jgi:CHAD domain-containing protein